MFNTVVEVLLTISRQRQLSFINIIVAPDPEEPVISKRTI